MSYYNNTNVDLLRRVPLGQGAVLEVGCGAGSFARSYRARSPLSRYIGVELFEEAAAKSRDVVDAVVVGDIEKAEILAALDEVTGGAPFDSIVFGDVLEHLQDPWSVLARLRERASPGAVCSICIPNVSHWSLLLQQLRGRWDYADAGLLDRTHLRFFTRASAIEMLEGAGWTVIDSFPRLFQPEKTAAAIEIFANAAKKLGLTDEALKAELAPLQWVIRAVNGPAPKPITVAALGMRKVAGVTDARVDHPMEALASRASVRAAWGAGTVEVPKDSDPGVLILHRQFMENPTFVAAIERRIAQGWVIVSEIDDDPHHWPEYQAAGFRAFRGVHAVSVSTEPLARMIRKWNPHIEIFPNAAPYIPETPISSPKNGDKLRVFFGALNREKDWLTISDSVAAVALDLKEFVEFVVVHDRSVFEALPDVTKSFSPTLGYDAYMRLLASCDIALLPLNDTPFNRLKSDLKFIESCAAGAVPICSSIVYGERPEHAAIGLFADSPAAWGEALQKLVADRTEIVRRRTLGLDYVKSRRMHASAVVERESVFRGLMERREQLEADRRSRLSASGLAPS